MSTEDRTLLATGLNGYGHLGTGDTEDRHSWTPVLENVSAIVAAATYSLALTEDGRLWGTGNNNSAELGTESIVWTWLLSPVDE